jgi:hypothetical protein
MAECLRALLAAARLTAQRLKRRRKKTRGLILAPILGSDFGWQIWVEQRFTAAIIVPLFNGGFSR